MSADAKKAEPKKGDKVGVPYSVPAGQPVDPSARAMRRGVVLDVGKKGCKVRFDDGGDDLWIHGYRVRVLEAASTERRAAVEVDERRPLQNVVAMQPRPAAPTYVPPPPPPAEPAPAPGASAEIDAWLQLGTDLLPRMEAEAAELEDAERFYAQAAVAAKRELDFLRKRIAALRAIAGDAS